MMMTKFKPSVTISRWLLKNENDGKQMEDRSMFELLRQRFWLNHQQTMNAEYKW